jgi:hypothetical protein
MKERCIDIRCIFFFAVILHRINDNGDNLINDNTDNLRGNRTAKQIVQGSAEIRTPAAPKENIPCRSRGIDSSGMLSKLSSNKKNIGCRSATESYGEADRSTEGEIRTPRGDEGTNITTIRINYIQQ